MAGFKYPTPPVFYGSGHPFELRMLCIYMSADHTCPCLCVPVLVVVLLVHHLEPRRHDGRLHHGGTPVDRQHRRRDGVEVRAVLDLAEEACGLHKREG